jgi:hypothetical protein
MRLTFSRAGVDRLIAELKVPNTKFRHAYSFDENKGEPQPALLLVGDQGIYLMTNVIRNEPHKPVPFIVYAFECNADKMDFYNWWSAKQRIFGGDDGVETILLTDLEAALATYRPGEDFKVDMTKKTFALVTYVDKPITMPMPFSLPKRVKGGMA